MACRWPDDRYDVQFQLNIQLLLLLKKKLLQIFIDDCTAFMQLLADSGKGLLDTKITKRYFLKLVRIFGELVSFYNELYTAPLFVHTYL